MAKKITEEDLIDKEIWANTTKSTNALLALIGKLEEALTNVAKNAKDNLGVSNVKDYENLVKTNAELEKLNKAYEQKLKLEKDRTKLQKAQEKALEQEVKIRNARIKAVDDFNKKEEAAAKRKAKTDQDAIKTAQKNRKATTDNANAYKRLSKQVNNAQARFKRLAAQYGENDKRTQKALKTFKKLDDRLRSINQTAKDGRRDVGRYTLAFSKLGTSLKNIATGLFIVQGIRSIGRAFGDAFSRIREFDSELQNIAGITGTTRESLKDLEESITFVAKSSIKTSTEVAKLATTLFTLGKTKEEVKLLLKPVNDLAIAFRVSSDEAADFLGQTLNAFGKSAGAAQRFADIIANVRTSTSLDFERIKDGLGFIAPTANALNLTLGETSALLGVLQDNGIRAARAGRLLNSSFARILEKGLTLEDALEQINESQNKTITSSELFGKEALALGLVLADNTEKTAALAEEFDNLSSGSLKELTDKQLDSLKSKLTTLDSAWEALIFTIENGTGPLSNFFKSAINNTTDLINKLIFANQNFQENLNDSLKEFNKDFILNEEEKAQKVISSRKKQLDNELDSLKKQGLSNKEYDKKKRDLLASFNKFQKGVSKEEYDIQRALYEEKLDALTTKYYSDETIKEEDFNAEKLRLEKEFFKKTDDARTSSFRKTQERLLLQISKFEGKKILPDVEVDLENPKKQLEEFLKFIDGKSSEIESSFKIATEPTTAEKTKAGIAGAFQLGKEFEEEKKRDEEIRKSRSEKLKLLIEQQDKLRIINLLLQDQNNLEEQLAIPKGTDKEEENKELIGLINNQAKAVADLNKEIAESVKENRGADNLIELNAKYAAAVKELERLRRVAFATREEFDKQQRDLIENEFDKRIEEEVVKSKKTQDLITTNETASLEERSKLLLKEQKRSADAINQINFERAKKEIDDNEAFQLELFKQSKRFAESEEDFQKRLAERKEQLDIEALNAEIALRKEFFNEVLTDEIEELILAEQLKSDAEIKAIKKRNDLTDEQKEEAIFEEQQRSKDAISLLELELEEGTSITIEELQSRIDAYTKFRDEQKEIDIDYFEVLRALNEKYFTDQLNRADSQISALERRQSYLQDLAAQGNRDAEGSLAENQKKEAEALRKREVLLQREKQFELALSVIESFRAELANPENDNKTGKALAKAVASTSVLTGVIASLPSFYEGTTDTGNSGTLDSNGGHLAVLHDNERVVDKKNNMKMGGISNDDAATIVHDFNNDLLSYNTPQLMIKEDRFDTNEKILAKFDSLEKNLVSAINNKETYLGSDIDTMKKLIMQTYSKGNTKTNVLSKYRVIK